MDNTTRSTDLEALEERLSRLDITVGQGHGAKLCVYTTCEPLFCFEADTHEEIVDLVSKTLESYILTFYQVNSVNVATKTVPIRAPRVPILTVNPISKLLLDFQNKGHRHEAYAG